MMEAESSAPLGLAAFDSLRAEDEPYLANCFVPPPDFNLIAGARSAVIYGGSGSGKTALRQALIWRATSPNSPNRLIVDWHPSPLLPGVPADLDTVRTQVACILDGCAYSLLRYLAVQSVTFKQAPAWAQRVLIWFVRRYLLGDLNTRIAALADEVPSADLLALFGTSDMPAVFPDSIAPDAMLPEFIKALAAIHLAGVWVMTDNLDTWLYAGLDQLANTFKAFLDTLGLFERPQFTYKLFLPDSLEPRLVGAGGLSRRRLDIYRLNWTSPMLQVLVERRLAYATGRSSISLSDLCAAPDLLMWLERSGGPVPRGWLEQIRPLLSQYLLNGCAAPISAGEWKKLRRAHPPQLFLDQTRRQIFVGTRSIPLENLPQKGYNLLVYLYQHAGQVCSKAELYYLAYLGLDSIPRSPEDKHWESPKSYEGVIDTNLWRLREAIEPDPSEPVFFITVKGHGIRLENAV